MRNRPDLSKLVTPGSIGALQLKNRIVMSSMGTRLAGLWGEVNEPTIAWYERRARGGAGLIIVEATHVATALFPVRGVIRMLRADDDSFCTGLHALAEAVHNEGSKIGIQLSVGRAAATGSLWTPGVGDLRPEPGMAPSAVRFPDGTTPREMTLREIQQTIKAFGKAAGRAKRAGFDAIELHAHFHSVPGCFLSPLFNRRKDKYGGDFDRRLRFVLEILGAMRESVGSGVPLLVKYSIDEFVPGGRDLNEGLAIAQRLEKAGVDGIVVSQGQAGSKRLPYAPLYWSEGYMVPLAEAVKRVVRIPVIVGGRLGDPVVAEQVLEEGKADFISMGRPLIADPDLPKKICEGRVRAIRRCLADNWCFEIFGKAAMRCTLNPEAGREFKSGEITLAPVIKRVVVVGAGPAGMEAARVAALRGHKVLLYEKARALGSGELKLASAAPRKGGFEKIAAYYGEAFRPLPNLQIELGTEATAKTILKRRPHAVIIATGGRSFVPRIPGIDSKNVVTAFDVLAGKAKLKGKNVVVCGGNAVGCETAHFLAAKEYTVTLVEMLDAIGVDIEPASLCGLKDDLEQHHVTILTGRKVVGFTNGAIQVMENEGAASVIPADTAVLALGVEPVNDLALALAGKVKELYVIGDANKPAKIHDAVHQGFAVALRL
jgi:2,4-dienoyl-CoA reductase-like NADH-dependent reductase (Old Yellow Enzyme family)/thioredoxin reductase